VPVDGETTEAFIEAIYQAKGMTDDLFILAECKPTAKKKARKKAKRKAKKKARKKAKKKAKKRGKRK
ncbi:MAG: hypothetical protein QGF91_05450, partial [Gammaproteobacteria bacterium]|nr:hypothetical protein [Gammaproteobacteria bacterium]